MGNLLQQKQIEGLGGGGALTPTNHRPLDQLVHNIAETSYEEPTQVNGIVSNYAYYTNGTKTTKIRDYNNTIVNGIVSQVVKQQYDDAGLPITGETLTKNLTITNGVIVSSTNTLT